MGLVALAPLMVVLAALVMLDSKGPAFFRQMRIGLDGRPFRIWKYRTMVREAETLGPWLTVGDDPRITRVGAWLRRTKLDELPQLLNVLDGSMSLVGPRPELPSFVDLYTPEERLVLRYVPGVTDPATLTYRNEQALLASAADPQRHYRDVVMREKIALNLAYARRATVLSDLGVIVKTLAALISDQ